MMLRSPPIGCRWPLLFVVALSSFLLASVSKTFVFAQEPIDKQDISYNKGGNSPSAPQEEVPRSDSAMNTAISDEGASEDVDTSNPWKKTKRWIEETQKQSMKRKEDSLSKEGSPEVGERDDEKSVSRKFLKIFDKRRDQGPLLPTSAEALQKTSASGITILKPDGWVLERSEKNNIVFILQEAGHPDNRIEVRKGVNIAVSRIQQYLDSFLNNVENAGFEPVLQVLENNEKAVRVKKIFGNFRGNYIKFHVGDVDVTNPLRGNKKVGLILFLFEGKKDAWIFAAFSTDDEINRIEPVFQTLIQTSKLDYN